LANVGSAKENNLVNQIETLHFTLFEESLIKFYLSPYVYTLKINTAQIAA